MPTLSSRSAPSQTNSAPVRTDRDNRDNVRPANSRPAPPPANRAARRRAAKRTARGTRSPRHSVPVLVVAIVIVGLTSAGCGQDSTSGAAGLASISPQECEQAVFDVLSGIIAKPQDDQPFETFVSRYGTQSATYAAYRDSFNPFYNEAVSHGIKAAENDVRGTVTKDCSADS